MTDVPASADGSIEIGAPEQLLQLIEEIEAMEEAKKAISDDIKDKYAEGKSLGYDPKHVRKIVSLRKIDKNTRDEANAILTTYMDALGMI